MITLEEAFDLLESHVADVLLDVEFVAVQTALNRVAAEDQMSQLDLPSFNKSAMDGYAILKGDKSESFELIETVPAGKTPQRFLSPGKTIKVMTGAPVPEATGQVIPVENANEDGVVVIFKSVGSTSHICQQGEDLRVGDLLIEAGTLLTPVVIANLIACGVTKIKVFKKPKISIISTGDEIVDSIDEIIPGKIMNSNGPMLQALCHKNCYEVVSIEKVSDNVHDTVNSLKNALNLGNIVVFTGGVSTGDYDFIPDALRELEFTIHFDRVAMKPGKPMTFASRENKFVFGLPGNPVSVFLTFNLFIKRAIKLMMNSDFQLNSISMTINQEFSRKSMERMEFVPCRLLSNDIVAPIDYHGSAHLAALMDADGFIVMPIGKKQINQGELVNFIRV